MRHEFETKFSWEWGTDSCVVCSGPPGVAEVEIQHQPSTAELAAVDEGGRW